MCYIVSLACSLTSAQDIECDSIVTEAASLLNVPEVGYVIF